MEERLKEGMGGGFGGVQKKNKKQLAALSRWLLVKRGGGRRDGVTEQTVAWTEQWSSNAHTQVLQIHVFPLVLIVQTHNTIISFPNEVVSYDHWLPRLPGLLAGIITSEVMSPN